MEHKPKEDVNAFLKDICDYLVSRIREQIHSAIDRNASLVNLVEIILKARRIHLYGMGRSGLMAKAFAMRLVHLGLDVVVLDETITYPLSREDVLILISGSGMTSSVVRLARIAKKIGAHIVAITSNEDSSLAKISDTKIILPVKEDELKGKYAPMGTLFEDSLLIFFDTLIAYLMDVLGETEESMRRRHASLE
ncbi:MAG: SIS domain-containing protein [Euryarchaeota archaeon]|nr:SIS domain-containing protein [Euryarchaeota archaeon]